jgi:hypothetical protein
MKRVSKPIELVRAGLESAVRTDGRTDGRPLLNIRVGRMAGIR